MNGFNTSIETDAVSNTFFRKVLYTGRNSQLVLMSLPPFEEIGLETHDSNDQFFRVEAGNGKCLIDEREFRIAAGDAVIVPAGAKHNIINASETEDLKLYTIYSPPHHRDGVEYATRAEADEAVEEFDGVTSEEQPDYLTGNLKLIAHVTTRISAGGSKKSKKKISKTTMRIVRCKLKIARLKSRAMKL